MSDPFTKPIKALNDQIKALEVERQQWRADKFETFCVDYFGRMLVKGDKLIGRNRWHPGRGDEEYTVVEPFDIFGNYPTIKAYWVKNEFEVNISPTEIKKIKLRFA